MTSFQRDAQKTLMLYACGPVLLFLVLGIVLIAASWQHYVVTRSDDVRMAATGRMEAWLSLYDEATAAVVAEDAETHGGLVPALRNDANARAELSSKLYRAANESRSGALFFLLDDERRIVLGSWKYLPASLDQTPADLGYLSRLHRAEAERLDEWLDGVSETAPDLAIGRRLSQGMVFFLLPGRFLMQELYSPYLDIVVTDEYDNVVLATDGRYLETDGRAPRKLAAPFHMTRGLATSAGERFFVTSDVLSTGWRVTTALPVSDLLTRYAMGMGSFFVVLLIFLPLLWQSARREGDARARAVHEQAARATAIADIRRLESQFQPHFLFNTLENIKYMIKLEPESAVRMVMALSKLLRYSIHGQERLVRFSEDLAYTHGFIEIQRCRFGERFLYEEKGLENASHCFVPRLILQPILENAIKYGESDDGTIHVVVTARHEDERLVLDVCDDGCGMEAEELNRLRAMLASEEDPATHTGLYNVHRRLQLLFGSMFGVSMRRREHGGTCVTMMLPWQTTLMSEEKESEGIKDASHRDRGR